MSATKDAAAPAIELIHVSRRFVARDGRATMAIRDFDMEVGEGEFIAIVGPTGCGKSTALSLITGLDRPSGGEVRLFGSPVAGIDERIGFVFQTDALFPWRSVIDNVVAGPLFRGKSKVAAYAGARNWLTRVKLTGHEAKYPHQLSGGMRKRVALAQTFINEPRILLMDEPFSALDVQTRVLMHDALLDLWAEVRSSVVFVTHDLEEAITLADRVYVLTASPATVKSVYRIDIARPRDATEIRYLPHFIELSHTIWNDLRDEVMKGVAQSEAAV